MRPITDTFTSRALYRGATALHACISGATLIEPSGQITFLDAELLRQGGRG
jgi:hypothetical protein